MFIYKDKFYKDEEGRIYTEEYLDHGGKFNKENLVWTFAGKETQMFPAEEYRDEIRTGKVCRCNYSQLFADHDNLILCNEISKHLDGFELYCGNDFDEETDYDIEIYQWYIIDDQLAYALKEHTNEIVYYYEDLDIYILGVTHWGTSWDYVDAEYHA